MDFEIIETLVTIPAGTWNLEVNLISWDGADPKYDIRKWNQDHTRMSKGITLTKEQFKEIIEKVKL